VSLGWTEVAVDLMSARSEELNRDNHNIYKVCGDVTTIARMIKFFKGQGYET